MLGFKSIDVRELKDVLGKEALVIGEDGVVLGWHEALVTGGSRANLAWDEAQVAGSSLAGMR